MEMPIESIKAYALKNAIEHDGKAILGAVINSLFNVGLTKDKIKNIIPGVQNLLNEINSLSLEKQKQEYERYKDLIGHRSEREGLPELPNIGKNGVVMRFAPAATGALHIGHIISNMSSSLYVKKYGGEFYVRIEDTNPETVDKNAYKEIKKDCNWLFENVTEYIIQSDRLKIYYKYAEELIKRNFAYVCTCENEEFKGLILKKKPCPCRESPKNENLIKWRKMLDKKGYKEGEAVVRFKSDLNNSNPAMRDFPLARINTGIHPRQKNKCRVWPLMNLSVTVDDIEFKMSHIIRGKDHKDNAERQKMIYKALGKEKIFPVVLFVGRVKFSDIALSKRKIKSAIERGEFEGAEDIRLPTIASLRKRGYQPEAFAKLAIQRGLSEVDKVISRKDFFEVLDNFNREILKEKTRKAEFEKISERDSNIVVLMPDNTKIFGKSKIKPRKDEIMHFLKFGYAKFNGKEKNKLLFWFSHR